MKDLFEILTEQGIEIPEDKKNGIQTEFFKNYKTVAEFDNKIGKLQNSITEKDNTIAGLKSEIEKIDTAEVETLKTKIADYEKAERQKAEELAKAEKRANLKKQVYSVKGDFDFINEGTENWIIDLFEKELEKSENTGKSHKEIYDNLVNGKDIYKNQNTRVVIPPAKGGRATKTDEEYMREAYKNNPYFKE